MVIKTLFVASAAFASSWFIVGYFMSIGMPVVGLLTNLGFSLFMALALGKIHAAKFN